MAALPVARGLARGGREAAALVLGLALAVAPATLRNLAVSGEPVLVSSHGGLNLYIGNRAEADGTYRHVPGITPDIRGQARDARRVAEETAGRPLTGSRAWTRTSAASRGSGCAPTRSTPRGSSCASSPTSSPRPRSA